MDSLNVERGILSHASAGRRTTLLIRTPSAAEPQSCLPRSFLNLQGLQVTVLVRPDNNPRVLTQRRTQIRYLRGPCAPLSSTRNPRRDGKGGGPFKFAERLQVLILSIPSSSALRLIVEMLKDRSVRLDSLWKKKKERKRWLR